MKKEGEPNNFRIPGFETLQKSQKVRLAKDLTKDDWVKVLNDNKGFSKKPIRDNLRKANMITRKTKQTRRKLYENIAADNNLSTNPGAEEFGYFLALDDESWRMMIRALREFDGADIDPINYVPPDDAWLPSTM